MWRQKAIKVSLNGDYDFLCKVYGLSGPQGTFPCLWCLTPRRYMNNTDKATFITRTLYTLIGDNASYTTHCGNKTKVASCNNCKNPLLITIELDKVAPQYLHILLGIALKHYKLLEAAVHKIDVGIT